MLVRGDSGRLVRILGNLLSNAVKFTRTGYIHVGASYGNGRLLLFVRDTGTGIDKERQQLIFSDFEQAGFPTDGGFGLGLAVTSRLVSLLGGDIRVESTPGRGSTFEVRLPLGEADMPDMRDAASGDGLPLNIRVLYIDDDRMQLDAVRRMYLRHGIECDCCTDIDGMVTTLRRNRHDLVRKYSINSLVYWVTYVHNVVYSFYRSMIYCYINSTQRCAGSIVIDIIPTNGADKRKFFPFAPYFPVTNVIKRYFYPYFPAIIGIKGYSFPYFPYLSGIMKIKTALYSLFSRLDWHKTVVFPCLGEIYEGIRSLSWEIPVT